MSTVSNVKNRAAELLGRKRYGQAIDAGLDARLDEAYSSVYSELKSDKLVIWANSATAEIPEEFIPHLAGLVAFDATASVSVSDARMNRIRERKVIADSRIPQLVKEDYETLTDQEDF